MSLGLGSNKNKFTLICWPICWLITTLTNALDIVTPFWAVISSSNVSEDMSF